MLISDFDFELPEELIAQTPPESRGQSRLLYLNPNQDDSCLDYQFSDIVDLIGHNDLLVVNDTKVIKARLFGQKETGGKIEILIERIVDATQAWASIRASHAPKVGSHLFLADKKVLVVVKERFEDRFLLEFDFTQLGQICHLVEFLEQYGVLPLPPYITRQPAPEDEARYQTVYADKIGAIAAPTAGLHFTPTLLEKLKQKGVRFATVTLHVGAGTFQPVRVENIAEHKMHAEWYHISQETVDAVAKTKQRGGDVIAVGTTSLRALESALNSEHTLQASEGETRLFIKPGDKIHIVDRLITNFHLPKSTLVMLVSALAGTVGIKQAYAHAILKKYRFFSYGDAMLIDKKRM